MVSFNCTVQTDPEDPSDTSCDLVVTIDNQLMLDTLTQSCDTCCGYIISLVAKSNGTVIDCRRTLDQFGVVAYLYVAGNI